MSSKIRYKASVAKDLKQIGRKQAGRLLAKLEAELGQDPNRGVLLKGKFKGLFRYRIGDYRIIYSKLHDGVLVLRIAPRKKAYR